MMKIFHRKPPSDYRLARDIERMDEVRRDRSNTPAQRNTADQLMFLLEGELRDRHDGRWPGSLV